RAGCRRAHTAARRERRSGAAGPAAHARAAAGRRAGGERGGATHQRRARQRCLPTRDGARADAARAGASPPRGPDMSKKIVSFTVNGEACDIVVTPNRSLLDALRNEAGLTGTKKGCDVGECG